MMWLINWLPWYVWATAVASCIVIAWPYLPSKMRVVVLAVATLGISYIVGRRGGSQYEIERQKQRDAAAVKRREEIEKRIAKRSDSDIKRDVDKWMRDK